MSILKRLINAFTVFINIVKTNYPVAISLGVLFVIFGVSDQGQDMLININATNWGPFTLYPTLIVLALIHWQFPKFFSQEALSFPSFGHIFTAGFSAPTHQRDFNRIVPRFFGVLTFIIPAYCIIMVLPKYDPEFDPLDPGIWSWLPAIYFWSMAIFFGLALWKNWFVKFYDWIVAKKYGRHIYGIICLLLLLSPVILWPFNYSRPGDQKFLALGWTFYALLFAMLTSTRWSIASSTRIPVLKIIFRDRFINISVWVVTLASALFFLFFVVTNWSGIVFAATYHFTFAIVLCGVIFYMAILTLLLYQSRRTRKNYLALVLITMILLAKFNPDYYHKVEKQKATGTVNVQPLKDYIRNWLQSRRSQISADSTYPIMLVNSYGGGIRAAAWTCIVINKLDSFTNGEFQKHVFSYSGASGGTIGASVVCANEFNPQFRQMNFPERRKRYHEFFTKNDFLTSDLVGLIGNDVFSSILYGNHFDDRAVFQTASWEKAYKNTFGEDIYGKDFFRLWNESPDSLRYRVPLLFSNSSEVKLGLKGILAPVALNPNDFTGDILVNDLLGKENTLKLSTASFLSARFPYISPAGEINHGDSTWYFIDGGAKENSGAETSFSVYTLMKDVIRESFPADSLKFPIYCISIKNTDIEEVNKEKHKKVLQLLAPVNSVINGGITGATRKADSINRRIFSVKDRYFVFFPKATPFPVEGKNLFGQTKGTTTKAILPLGWQLSDLAMSFMEASTNQEAAGKKPENSYSGFLKLAFPVLKDAAFW